MQSTSVTSKRQITIPKKIWQQLGICQGSKLEVSIVGDHIELYICDIPANVTCLGFTMRQSSRTAVPTDFDSTSLLDDDRLDTNILARYYIQDGVNIESEKQHKLLKN